MKKIGYFFSGFLPILTTTAAQILASFFMFGIAALFLCPASQSTGFDADTIETLLTNTEFNACIMLIYTVTCIVFMGIWYYRSCGGNYLPKPSLTFHPLQFLSIILLIPGMQFFSGYLTSAVSLLFPNWLSQYEKLMETAGLDSDIGLFMFIYAVILGPVCEELVFRGVTIRLVRRALPFWAANLMQAVLFGIFHMNWIQGIYAFVLGLVLGWICEKGGLASIVLLVWLPRSINKPIQELTRGILEIANHNYEKRLNMSGHEEFRQVADSFNSMAERLTEYRASTLNDILSAKKFLEAVVNSIHEPIIGLNCEHEILFINKEALTVLNLKREDVIRHSAEELSLKNDLLRRLVRELITPGEKKEPLKILGKLQASSRFRFNTVSASLLIKSISCSQFRPIIGS